MNARTKKLAVLFVLTLTLFAGAKHMNAEAPAEAPAEQQLTELAEQWCKQLAADPSFATWRGAKLSVYPLGPGTHSWMVILSQQEERVGYFIIHAVENGGYTLGEYGLDPYISLLDSFEQQTSLLPGTYSNENNEAAAFYYIHPFLAVYASNNAAEGLYELFSSEQLPVTIDQFKVEAQSSSLKAKQAELQALRNNKIATAGLSRLASFAHVEPFDSYASMPWLTKASLNQNYSLKDIDKLKAQIIKTIQKDEQLRYVTEQYNGKVLFASSVTGYHQWDEQLYVALSVPEHQTAVRYVPLPDLMAYGHFYR